MSKLLLHYRTTLGSRTVVAEIGDEATAQAVRAAHQALGEACALVEEMPRLSMADHLAKHRKKVARAKLRVIQAAPNVTPLRRAKP